MQPFASRSAKRITRPSAPGVQDHLRPERQELLLHRLGKPAETCYKECVQKIASRYDLQDRHQEVRRMVLRDLLQARPDLHLLGRLLRLLLRSLHLQDDADAPQSARHQAMPAGNLHPQGVEGEVRPRAGSVHHLRPRMRADQGPYTVCRKVAKSVVKQVPYTLPSPGPRGLRGRQGHRLRMRWPRPSLPGMRHRSQGHPVPDPADGDGMHQEANPVHRDQVPGRRLRGRQEPGQLRRRRPRPPFPGSAPRSRTSQVHTTCKMVQSTVVKKIPYTVCQNVVEDQVQKVPYTVCRMVPRPRPVRSRHTVCETQKYTEVRKVPKVGMRDGDLHGPLQGSDPGRGNGSLHRDQMDKVCVPETVCVKRLRKVAVPVSRHVPRAARRLAPQLANPRAPLARPSAPRFARPRAPRAARPAIRARIRAARLRGTAGSRLAARPPAKTSCTTSCTTSCNTCQDPCAPSEGLLHRLFRNRFACDPPAAILAARPGGPDPRQELMAPPVRGRPSRPDPVHPGQEPRWFLAFFRFSRG